MGHNRAGVIRKLRFKRRRRELRRFLALQPHTDAARKQGSPGGDIAAPLADHAENKP
jgi:hypothetical protein